MKTKISKKTICLVALISFLSISSCEKIDDLNDSIDQSIDEMLGISALSEDLNKTSSNYNIISDIVINNKLVSSSETKMTLPSSVSVSYTKKRYALTGSMWNISSNSYSGTIPRSMFNKTSNVVKISVQSNNPTVYVNNVVASIANSGGTGGTGSTGTSTGETILKDLDVTGSKYELKVVSFAVPTGVTKLVVKLHEPTVNYRNLADLFVRKGSAPIVSKTAVTAYTWTTDYTSQTPNREIKICTITNPPSGTWYAGLFGYSSDYTSRLTVTITK